VNLVEFYDFVKTHNNFIITTHLSPDPDGLGAEIGLFRALKKYGKNVRIINAMPYASRYQFLEQEQCVEILSDTNTEILKDKSWNIILLDTNDINFIGKMADYVSLDFSRLFIIDHHDMPTDQKNMLILSDYSSTCEIIFDIIKMLKIDPDAQCASALLTGIVYDTGSFAYSKTGIHTFEVAAELYKYGANPTQIHSLLYESSSISVLLLKKAVLSTLELFHNNQIALLLLTEDILKKTKAELEDANDIINVPLQCESVKISIFLKQESRKQIRCSLRSKGTINVASIAQDFGGGGHKNAAGFRSELPLKIVKEKVIRHIESQLDKQ